jgi:hypothetical protein
MAMFPVLRLRMCLKNPTLKSIGQLRRMTLRCVKIVSSDMYVQIVVSISRMRKIYSQSLQNVIMIPTPLNGKYNLNEIPIFHSTGFKRLWPSLP